MIELLEPVPGQRILDLAAGPGETGFIVLPLIQPGGELLSTDAAPEMVEVARRRAATLGLDGVEFAVEDAARLTLPDDSVDGIICRFGLMLVPDMESAAAEIARVLRPGGRVGARGLGELACQSLDHRRRPGPRSTSASPTHPTTTLRDRSGSATRSGCARWSRAAASRSR